MKKLNLFIVLFTLFTSSVFAHAHTSDKATAPRQNTSAPSEENSYHLPAKLLPLWNSLTPRQKVAQMVMVYMSPVDYALENEFGGLLVMKPHLKDPKIFKRRVDSLKANMTITPLIALDQEGGRVNRMSVLSPKWERTPSAKEMRRMHETQIFETAKAIGKTMQDYGINVNLAPVLDPAIDSHGKPSFMEESNRSWGKDTSNANKVRAFVKGMKANGIACASKHFPGYDSWTNSDTQIAVSVTPKNGIAKNILFFKTLARDIPITMMSSVQFTRISRRPAVFDKKIVAQARKTSPESVILTDDLWGTSLRAWISGAKRVKHKNYPKKDYTKLIHTALDAGNDMFMITYPAKAVELIDYLTNLCAKNPKYLKRIETSAARILKMKYKTGILTINN